MVAARLRSASRRLEVEPGSKLHVRKVTEPCAGSEIVIVLEHEGSGTKVTVSQSGFPAWFASATDALRDRLASHRRGPRALPRSRRAGGRHARSWAMLGCSLLETLLGARGSRRHARHARGGHRPGGGRRRADCRWGADRDPGRARDDDADLAAVPRSRGGVGATASRGSPRHGHPLTSSAGRECAARSREAPIVERSEPRASALGEQRVDPLAGVGEDLDDLAHGVGVAGHRGLLRGERELAHGIAEVPVVAADLA